MQTLVESKAVIIQVKDVNGYCVCTKCRGAKMLNHVDYHNPNAFRTGGLYVVSHQEPCSKCNGEGFWKIKE